MLPAAAACQPPDAARFAGSKRNIFACNYQYLWHHVS